MRASGLAVTITAIVGRLIWPAAAAQAQWVPDGAPVATTSASDYFPRIASDAAGGAFVVWDEYTSPNSAPKAQHIDADGYLHWPGGLPIVGSENVCPDGAGGFYVASPSLFIQRYGADGSVAAGWPSGGIQAANPGGSVYPLRYGAVKLQLASDGSLLVAWSAFYQPYAHEAYFRVAAQKLSASGAQLWGPNGVEVVPYPPSAPNGDKDPTISGIVSDGSGGAVLTWDDKNASPSAQRINAAGIPLWRAGGRPLGPPVGFFLTTAIVADGAGGAFVAWDGQIGNGNLNVYVQHVAADSTLLWGPNAVAASSAPENKYGPAVLVDGSGGVFVAWESRTPSAVWMQHILSDGTRAPGWSTDGARVGSGGNCIQHITLLPDNSAGVLVGWGTSCSSDTVGDIRAQRLTGSGSISPGWPIDGVLACTAPGAQNDPFTTTDGAGGMILAWEDSRVGRYQPPDVYAQRVSPTGVTLEVPERPAESSMKLEARPNPTRGAVTFSVTLAVAADVRLEIIDLEGRVVRVVDSRHTLSAGTHSINWNGRDNRDIPVSSGVYFARISGSGLQRRITLLR